MTETATKRKYRLSFIFDTRGYEEPAEGLIELARQTLTELGAEILEAGELQRREFVRVTDRHHAGDFYLHLTAEGPPSLNREIQERFRLEKRVKRILVESI